MRQPPRPRPDDSQPGPREREPDRQLLGRLAEDAAVHFLQSHQLTLLTRNYRCRSGELDIVALTPQGVLVIAEVRLRASARYGGGAASVDFRKQRRIQRATGHLLVKQPALAKHAIRFDVLDLSTDESGEFRINWIRQAFEAVNR